MTVAQFSQRLARWTSSKTLSQMPMEDRLILVDCINAAVYNWFAAAPERMRMTTISHLLRAPEQGSATVTAETNDLTGVTLQDYHLGASIEFDNETNFNEIVSVAGTPKVLNSFRNSGLQQYTIYFDTIMITDYLINRIVNHPRILDTGEELYRDDDAMRFKGAERRGSIFDPSARSLGSPYRYVFENTGLSLQDEARAMIRIDPIPDRALTINFDAVVDAPTLEVDSMNGSVDIAVPDQYVLPHLLPLALSDLALTPIWSGSNADSAIAKGQATIAKIQGQITQNQGAPQNRFRTRPGW